MNLPYDYWYFTGELTSRFCDDLIKEGLKQQEIIATTGYFGNGRDLKKNPLNKEELKILREKRDSNISWLVAPWIYREIHPYIHIANKNAGWNFQWHRTEPCQFTKYKHNQFYGWHQDNWNKPNENGEIRKLSIICQLTDSSDYTGGELEFDFRHYEPNLRNESEHVVQVKEILSKGSIIVFPCNIWHRVQPITSGTRYSLVMWNLGNSFQ